MYSISNSCASSPLIIVLSFQILYIFQSLHLLPVLTLKGMPSCTHRTNVTIPNIKYKNKVSEIVSIYLLKLEEVETREKLILNLIRS